MHPEIATARLTAGKRKIDYVVVPTSRKKTLALQVDRGGGVRVLVPRKSSRSEIKKFVGKHVQWIFDRKKYYEELSSRYPPKEFKSGETFSLLGLRYRLKVIGGVVRCPTCRIRGRRLEVRLNGSQQSGDCIRETVRNLYIRQTAAAVKRYVRKHAPSLGVRPAHVRVVEQKSRWGSCSRAGALRFNWRLSMAPFPILEYVVVHELCHLKTHNHSARFWRLLQSIIPDYGKRRAWLVENSAGFVSAI